MTQKTCLLVTDDADDHVAFSEAIRELSDRTAVLIVLDSDKALTLLQTRKLVPDYLFLDLSMHGMRISNFLRNLNDHDGLSHIPIIVYGDLYDFQKVDNPSRVKFFDKEFEYSELKKFLNQIL